MPLLPPKLKVTLMQSRMTSVWRGAGADRDPLRVQPDGAAGRDPADRHRQKERDLDDRLRARRRTQPRFDLTRGDLSGLPETLPADHHDDDGGDARRGAARDRLWRGCRIAPPARDYDRRRAGHEPAADPLHNTRHLSLPRSPSAVGATPRADPPAPAR